jgi:5-formyltetrahydrofolate cyclo-ligase
LTVASDPDGGGFIVQAKAELRRRMRTLRSSIPPDARAARSEKIVARVATSTLFDRAAVVGLFWPLIDRGEVDVRPLDAIARSRGKMVAYPFYEAMGEMTLRLAAPEMLCSRGHGFSEPPDHAPVVETDPGLLIVTPALAVDLMGNRIGYGIGYYDRLLARMVPPACTIAVAYDFQVLVDLPVGDGDQPVGMVITDAREHVVA